jgi:hypothetical protein
MPSQGNLLHDEYLSLSQMCGYGVRRAGVDQIILDSDVAAAASIDPLVTIANNPPPTVHDEYATFEALLLSRALTFGQATGDFSNARVVAAGTVEGLAESTTAADEQDSTGHLGPRLLG